MPPKDPVEEVIHRLIYKEGIIFPVTEKKLRSFQGIGPRTVEKLRARGMVKRVQTSR